MDVYVMGIVNCPMNNADQDVDQCLMCKYYAGHEINKASSKAKRLYIACQYESRGVIVYESSKSKHHITVVEGEKFPCPPQKEESWKERRLPR